MRILDLDILAPKRNDCIEGDDAKHVQLLARLNSLATTQLYYAWYSSLQPGPMENWGAIWTQPEMDEGDGINLGPGSHVITLVVKDKTDSGYAKDSLVELYQSLSELGVAGGPPPPRSESQAEVEMRLPCVIHVFVANIIKPQKKKRGEPPTLDKISAELEAEAPLLWADKDYKEYNRLQYRWQFTPSGPPAERKSGELCSNKVSFKFVKANKQSPISALRYQGPLPDTLDIGLYELTLRVEHKDNPSIGHQVPRQVNIV